jgi:hypothetical protein
MQQQQQQQQTRRREKRPHESPEHDGHRQLSQQSAKRTPRDATTVQTTTKQPSVRCDLSGAVESVDVVLTEVDYDQLMTNLRQQGNGAEQQVHQVSATAPPMLDDSNNMSDDVGHGTASDTTHQQ